jgi:hypothetical protein
MVPMTMPTSAHARPTGSAWRAPSASAQRHPFNASRPRPLSHAGMISASVTRATAATLHLIEIAHTRPSAIQNSARNAVTVRLCAMASPRISATVSARPTAPANNGVKPANSR